MSKLIFLAAILAIAGVARSQAADAKANYQKHCAKCHGADGKGDTKTGKKMGVKDYTNPVLQDRLKDPEAFKAIKEGVKERGKVVMKPTAGLTDQEIKDLVAYLRKFKK
jgi:cytochrome c553